MHAKPAQTSVNRLSDLFPQIEVEQDVHFGDSQMYSQVEISKNKESMQLFDVSHNNDFQFDNSNVANQEIAQIA